MKPVVIGKISKRAFQNYNARRAFVSHEADELSTSCADFQPKALSYKELPQRYCETTMVYRDEQTGELAGLSRVRSISQDDAHVFCTQEQTEREIEIIWDIVNRFYKTFNFALTIRFSRHDPASFEKFGTQEIWKLAEQQMLNVVKKEKQRMYGLGEAAFYGPKLISSR